MNKRKLKICQEDKERSSGSIIQRACRRGLSQSRYNGTSTSNKSGVWENGTNDVLEDMRRMLSSGYEQGIFRREYLDL